VSFSVSSGGFVPLGGSDSLPIIFHAGLLRELRGGDDDDDQERRKGNLRESGRRQRRKSLDSVLGSRGSVGGGGDSVKDD